MASHEVKMTVLGAFTITTTQGDTEEEAYDYAVDAFFNALDAAGITYDIERRILEGISVSDNNTDDNETVPTSP